MELTFDELAVAGPVCDHCGDVTACKWAAVTDDEIYGDAGINPSRYCEPCFNVAMGGNR